ncbi:MAG: BON domain-containing protein [Rhodoferax sp.]
MKIHDALRRTTLALLAAGSLCSLSACFPLAVGGAVAGGLVAVDRRTSGTVIEDEGIEIKAGYRLRENLGGRGHINVASYNRQVLLIGEVASAQDRQLAEKLVGEVENVRNVVNDLEVMENSSLTQRSNDVLVSGRIKAALLDAQDLFVNSFKISVERGNAYMMGRVTQREASHATEIVSATNGVKRVVRVLEIISEEELARIQPPPPAPAKPKP